jgi:RING finger family protein
VSEAADPRREPSSTHGLVVAEPAASAPRRSGRWLLAFGALAALTYVWPLGLAVVLTGICLAYGLTKAVAIARLVRAQENLEPSIEERGRRCPFCREDFAAGEVVESCAACETVHHAECREEFGACATFACEAPTEPGRRFAIAQDLVVGWEHPEAVEIDGEVATPFPNAFNYDPVTGLRRLGVEDYAS